MNEEYKEPLYAAPPLLQRMVDAGRLGRKSGVGVLPALGSAPTPSTGPVQGRVHRVQHWHRRCTRAAFAASRGLSTTRLPVRRGLHGFASC